MWKLSKCFYGNFLKGKKQSKLFGISHWSKIQAPYENKPLIFEGCHNLVNNQSSTMQHFSFKIFPLVKITSLKDLISLVEILHINLTYVMREPENPKITLIIDKTNPGILLTLTIQATYMKTKIATASY